MSVCDCPVAAASLEFLKQEGLSAAPSTESVKLPGYRGNGLEGLFKDTVTQQLLLQIIQVFSENATSTKGLGKDIPAE